MIDISILTLEEITDLSSRTGVNQNAVFNFLISTYPEYSYLDSLANLEYDRKLYNLNKKTVDTIKEGLKKGFNKE